MISAALWLLAPARLVSTQSEVRAAFSIQHPRAGGGGHVVACIPPARTCMFADTAKLKTGAEAVWRRPRASRPPRLNVGGDLARRYHLPSWRFLIGSEVLMGAPMAARQGQPKPCGGASLFSLGDFSDGVLSGCVAGCGRNTLCWSKAVESAHRYMRGMHAAHGRHSARACLPPRSACLPAAKNGGAWGLEVVVGGVLRHVYGRTRSF